MEGTTAMGDRAGGRAVDELVEPNHEAGRRRGVHGCEICSLSLAICCLGAPGEV